MDNFINELIRIVQVTIEAINQLFKGTSTTLNETIWAIIIGVISSILYSLFLEGLAKWLAQNLRLLLRLFFSRLLQSIKPSGSLYQFFLKLYSKIQQAIATYLLPKGLALSSYLRAPKWYELDSSAIDAGLIEVSIAVSAALIALSTYVTPGGSPEQIRTIQWVKILCLILPTVTSINLLNRYVKNKGSKSRHVLVSPVLDGTFFLLGWSIVLGFIFVAIVAFQL